MSAHLDTDGREPLSEQNLAVATLVGRYIERREHHGEPVCAEDLFAAAADFGDSAVDALRILIACYEAMHATE